VYCRVQYSTALYAVRYVLYCTVPVLYGYIARAVASGKKKWPQLLVASSSQSQPRCESVSCETRRACA
jgi:hypothetical protein